MEMPVPEDWDGETWECIQIQWPDSAQWSAILAGLITSIQRGPFWRARNKVEVEAAKSLGRSVVVRNLPFVPCADCGDGGNCTPDSMANWCRLSGHCGGIVIEGDFDMGQVVTDVQIVDGKLRVFFGHCCWEDLELTGLCNVPGEDVPPDVTEPTEPPIDQACRDAWAYAKTVQSFANELADMLDSELDFWNWEQELKSRWPFLKRGDWSIYEFLVEMKTYLAVLDGLGIQYYFTDGEAEQLMCGVLPQFDDISGITQAEFDAALSVLRSQGGVTTGDWAVKCVQFAKQECIDPNVRAYVHQTEPDCSCVEVPAGAYFEVEFDYDFEYYSPNTNVDYQVDMLNATVYPGVEPVAAVWEAHGQTSGNGLAKLPEFNNEVIVGSEAEYSRTFGLYRNDEGHNWLNLFEPALSHIQVGNWDTFDDEQFTVNITGNNVQVDGQGTVRLIYKTSDVYGE